jgi:hypothetical protein
MVPKMSNKNPTGEMRGALIYTENGLKCEGRRPKANN